MHMSRAHLSRTFLFLQPGRGPPKSVVVQNFFVTRRLSNAFVSLIRPSEVRDIFVTEQ